MASKSPESLRDVVEGFMRSSRFRENAHPAFAAIANNLEGSDSAQVAFTSSQNDGVSASGLVSTQAYTTNYAPLLLVTTELDVPLDELYRDAEQAKVDFRNAILQYESQCPPEAKCGIDTKSMHTWDEIIVAADNALRRYKKPGGVKGFMRRMRDLLGNNKSTALAWAEFLPSEQEYFSILCGGLKLIIRAAARMTTLAEEITSALERIPDMLNFTQGTLTIFRSSEDLHRYSSNFYVALIEALIGIMEYLKKSSIARFAGALLKVESFAKSINDSVELVDKRSQQFKDCAQRCLYAISADSNRVTKMQLLEARQAHQENHEDFETIKADCREQAAEIVQLRCQVDQARQQVCSEISSGVEALDQRVQQQLKPVFDALSQLLASHDDKLRPGMNGLRKAVSMPNMCNSLFLQGRDEILQSLEYNDEVTDHDLTSNLRIFGNAGIQAQDKAQAIMRHKKMLTWVAQPKSGALFVNGNHAQSYRQAPTSIVSAQLTRSIGIAAPHNYELKVGHCFNIALSFFCGQHRNLKDPNSGPDGMIRNLIAQLLSAGPGFDLTNIRQLHDVDTTDLVDLCEIFRDLIMQLTEQYIIFCILDNISIFEHRDEWQDQAMLALKLLTVFARPKSGAECTFKLLLTSSTKSTRLYHALPRDDVIFMPEKVPAMVRMTERTWKEMLSQKFSGARDETKATVEEEVPEMETESDSDYASEVDAQEQHHTTASPEPIREDGSSDSEDFD